MFIFGLVGWGFPGKDSRGCQTRRLVDLTRISSIVTVSTQASSQLIDRQCDRCSAGCTGSIFVSLDLGAATATACALDRTHNKTFVEKFRSKFLVVFLQSSGKRPLGESPISAYACPRSDRDWFGRPCLSSLRSRISAIAAAIDNRYDTS